MMSLNKKDTRFKCTIISQLQRNQLTNNLLDNDKSRQLKFLAYRKAKVFFAVILVIARNFNLIDDEISACGSNDETGHLSMSKGLR